MTDHLHQLLTDLVDDLPPLEALPAGVARRGRRRRAAKLSGLGLGVLGAVVALPLVLGGGRQDRLQPEQFAPPAPTPSATATGASTTPARVDLVAEGLRLSSGSTSTALDFGLAEDQLVAALSASLRDPAERADLPDCGPSTVAVSFGRFTAYVVDGLFQGWRDNGAGLATADGLRVGSTLTEVRAARAELTVTETTLGTELTAGGLSGLVEADVVTSLAAGQTCVFR